MKSIKLEVNMTCATCANKIDAKLKELGVESNTNPALQIVKAKFDESKCSESEIIKAINSLGYNAKKR